MYTFFLVTILIISNIFTVECMNPDQAAAECIARIKDCTAEIAGKSVSCKPHTFVKAQPRSCLLAACGFCQQDSSKELSICTSSWAISYWCSKINLHSSPTSAFSHTPKIKTSVSEIPSPSRLDPLSQSPTPTIFPSHSSSYAPSNVPSPSSIVTSFTLIPSPTGTSSNDALTTSPPVVQPSILSPLPSVSPVENYTSDYAAALCIAQLKDCSGETANQTEHCAPGLFALKQHPNCLKAACIFCRRPLNRILPVCKSWSIKKWCPTLELASMTPTTSPSGSPSVYNPSPSSSISVSVGSSSPVISASASLEPDSGLSPDHAAAKCISLGLKCMAETAEKSGLCEPKKFVKQQSSLCLKRACNFCRREQNHGLVICLSWAIKNWCPQILLSSVTPTKSPNPSQSVKASFSNESPSHYPACVYPEKDGVVVIPMEDVSARGLWTKIAGGKGIIWREGDNRTSVDSWKSSSSSEYCFDVLIKKSGKYYITAHSSAPHWSEHNDMWIRCSAGVDIYDAKTNKKKRTRIPKTGFFKAYQNFGGNRVSEIISTVNHDPHIFVTTDIDRHTIVKLCIAGRSSKFTVYDLVMIHCMDRNCMRSSVHIRQTVRSLVYTRCQKLHARSN